jgi:Fe-S cluster biosynthesis and repair protein YggX
MKAGPDTAGFRGIWAAVSRMVECAKLADTLPGLPYKPFNDAFGQRIYDNISAKAWQDFPEQEHEH